MHDPYALSRSAPTRARTIGWSLLAIVGCGVGTTLLFWHSETLQLHPLGGNFVWPVIIGAGVMAMSRGVAASRTISALLVGSALGVILSYEGLNYLPVTALGIAMAVGLGAMLVTAASLMSRGRVPFGPSVIGFGLGVGAAQIVPAGPTTTPTDVLAIFTAVAFALGIGVAGSLLVEAFWPREMRATGSEQRASEESGRQRSADETTVQVVDVRDRQIDVTEPKVSHEIPAADITDPLRGGRES